MFSLGRIVATPNAINALETANAIQAEHISVQSLLARHHRGDWGDLDEEDKRSNDLALRNGARIFSAYLLVNGEKVWIITEADRSSTTILLPEDY